MEPDLWCTGRTRYLLIQKGFMTLEALLDALNAAAIQERDTVIYHFRIATSGGITPANCHPFPVSANVNDLKSLTIACKAAFVHNGVLGKGKRTCRIRRYTS